LHRAWGGRYNLPAEGPLLPRLAALAYDMQRGRAGRERSQVRLPEAAVRRLLDSALAGDLLAAGVELNVLDKTLEKREIAFYHQLLQEYFAARVLARAPDPARVQTPWRADAVQPALAQWLATADAGAPLPPAPATGWEETALLAAAMAPDPAAFTAGLLETNLPLAARCAASPEVDAPPALVERLQTALLARLADPAADLRARIAAAEALGELGDPRFARRAGPHGPYLRPPLAPIPGGTVPIGDDAGEYDDEKPAHKVAIAPFEIGVFPVTNAEYRLFMEAGGYADDRWWQTAAAEAWLKGEGSNEGVRQRARDEQNYLQDFSDDVIRQQKVSPEQIEFWLWLKHASSNELERQYEEWYPSGKVYRQPEFWDDSRFNHPAQPVVGVSWFEARAYCAWLTAQMGRQVDLPTEAEWEAAARGAAGRAYAYGERFDALRGNTFETHVRRTTPVGVFPDGRTPQGVYDLSGNVWEWTSTIWGRTRRRPEFPYPYVADDGREDPQDGVSWRVLRGGSWNYFRLAARAVSRYFGTPDSRASSVGWRVVVRRSPSHLDH
jgi:formylglycine-generating enzyme required for sulfatase activity